MKVLRIICPKCNKERRITSEEEDLHSYEETTVNKKCPHHTETPEEQNTEKLLKAIFGEKDE